jgi:hypothetical protein
MFLSLSLSLSQTHLVPLSPIHLASLADTCHALVSVVDVLVARAVALEAKRLSAGVVDHLEVANLVVPIMHVGLIHSIFELSRFQWPGLETLAPM